MKSKFLHKYIKTIIIAFIIFIIGTYSYLNHLNCSLSWSQNPQCDLAKYISYLFASEIHIGLAINNLLNLPFNTFNLWVIIIHLIYSYIIAWLIISLFNKINKRASKK